MAPGFVLNFSGTTWTLLISALNSWHSNQPSKVNGRVLGRVEILGEAVKKKKLNQNMQAVVITIYSIYAVSIYIHITTYKAPTHPTYTPHRLHVPHIIPRFHNTPCTQTIYTADITHIYLFTHAYTPHTLNAIYIYRHKHSQHIHTTRTPRP